MLFAKVEHPNAGYNCDKENVNKLDTLKLYEVEYVEMGQSYTSIYLLNIDCAFNSVNFEFYDEDSNNVNIFSMPEYNPYL